VALKSKVFFYNFLNLYLKHLDQGAKGEVEGVNLRRGHP